MRRTERGPACAGLERNASSGDRNMKKPILILAGTLFVV
jgi:hypothetical protein